MKKFTRIKPKEAASASTPAEAVSKPQRFALDAEAAGWEAERIIDGSRKTVRASRGDEVLVMTWDGDRFDGPGAYGLGEHSHTVLNAASGRRILAASPDVAAAALNRAAVSRRRKVNPASASQRASRPLYDVAVDSDEEILAMLVGRRITWLSSLSAERDSAVVPVNGKRTQITGDAELRQLTFCDAEGGGYRTVWLSAIGTVSPEVVDDGHMITLMMARAMNAMRENKKVRA